MRILWLINRYYPAIGGAELHSREIIHELAKRGHTVGVVAHWDSNRTDWLRGTTICAPRTVRRQHDGERVEVLRLGYGGPVSPRRLRTLIPAATYYLWQPAAYRLAGMIEHDIMRLCGAHWDVVHAVRTGREPLHIAGSSIARRLNVPFVLTPLHHPRWIGRRYSVYLDLYRRADELVALTAAERELYAELGVPASRVTISGIGPVLPPTADGDRFRATHNIRGPLALFLGQKYPYKGYDLLLEAAPMVWNALPDVTFAFLGPRTPASRRTFARRVDARLLELDAVDLQTKGDALAACDLFCLPSAQESFGGVFTEAWSYAKPVIGRDIAAVREVIGDGQDGLLVHGANPSELAANIVRLLGDEELRTRLGNAGQRKVERMFAWPRVVDRIEEAYRMASARKIGHPSARPSA
jgi:glycosyltransferase involved in cell wall biosynthesis